MNIKKIKLGLSIQLLNFQAENLLQGIKETMQSFNTEVGNFLSLSLIDDTRLNASYMHREYALRYEHATLNIELVTNPFTNLQSVHHFSLTSTSQMAA